MRILGDEPLAALGGVASCVGHAVTVGLSRVVKRDPFLWVFGARAGEAFAGNAKYLFLHVCARHPEIRAVWLSTNRSVVATLQRAGYEAYRTDSARGTDLNRRAGVTFLTHGFGDVRMSWSGGALSVMLWHGTPLKKISWDADFGDRPLATQAAASYAYRRFDVLTAATDATTESFVSGFRADPEIIVPTGYPRNDVLDLNHDHDRDRDRELPGQWIGVSETVRGRVRSLSRRRQVWLYLPTFRRIDGASTIADHVDFVALDSFLAERGVHLLVKAHPFERLALNDDLDRVEVLPAAIDVYPLLPLTDGLLTDYSSILFDYLLRDRPIVLYPYDLDRYRAERDFYYEYEAVAPGPIATDFDELLGALDAAMDAEGSDGSGAQRQSRTRDGTGTGSNDGAHDADRSDDDAEKRARLRKRFCRVDVNRSERVCEAVFERLGVQ